MTTPIPTSPIDDLDALIEQCTDPPSDPLAQRRRRLREGLTALVELADLPQADLVRELGRTISHVQRRALRDP